MQLVLGCVCVGVGRSSFHSSRPTKGERSAFRGESKGVRGDKCIPDSCAIGLGVNERGKRHCAMVLLFPDG